MPIRVPPGIRDSIDRWSGRFEERKRIVETRERQARTRSSNATDKEIEAAVRRQRAAAHTIAEWLDFLDFSGATARLLAADVHAVPLTGPLSLDAEPVRRYRGIRAYELSTDNRALLMEFHIQYPTISRTTSLRSEDRIESILPPAICRYLAREIESGNIWRQVRDALLAGEV